MKRRITSALHKVLRTDAPVVDAPVSEPVTLINVFTVLPEESERFLTRWKDNARRR